MTLSEDKKAEILNNHYRDTCTRIESYRKRRNRLALYIGIVIGIMYLMLFHPENIINIIASALKNKTGIDLENTSSIFHKLSPDLAPEMLIYPLIYMIILFITVIYKHYTTAIDKQYDYIQIIESKLNSYFSESSLFTRETNFSSRENPTFSMWSNDFCDKLLKYSFNFLLPLIIIKEVMRDGFGTFEMGIAFGWLSAHGLIYKKRIKQFWIKLTNIFRRSSGNPEKQS